MEQHNADAIRQVEREAWDRAAPAFSDNGAKLTAHAVGDLIEAASITVGCRALEIGCGPGHVTKRLAEAGAEATGVDLAPAMVAVARRSHPELSFEVADAEELPFDDDTFDVVLINFAIHHLPQPARACEEIYRVLVEGGRFVFAGPIEQFGFGAFIEGLSAHHTMDDLPHGPIYLGATREDYVKLVKNAGFGAYDVTVRQITLQLGSLEPLLVSGWEICALDRLSAETQDKIRATTIEKAAPYKTDQGYAFPDQILVGVATK